MSGVRRTRVIEKAMTLLVHRGEGPAFSYAGQPMHILAGHRGEPPGFAAMELTVPPHFAGPIPHAHDEFDEAIYVLSGRLQVLGEDEPQEASPGSMFVAPRGNRHGFSNPFGEQATVLGLWAPPEPALAFMREIGAALTGGHPARSGPHARDLRPARQPPPALISRRLRCPPSHRARGNTPYAA
jgi:quercetin dioxygenase-like cupin family protein